MTNKYTLDTLVFVRDHLIVEQTDSKFGVCQITGLPFENEHDFQNHHIIPKEFGGSDTWTNRIIIKTDVHKLIHAVKEDTIKKYLGKYNFNNNQMMLINYYRKLAHRKSILFKKSKTISMSDIGLVA